MKIANDETFDEIRGSEKLTLIDFFATWCMPCRMQAEVLENLNTSRIGEFDIVKVNVDESPNLANEFEISSIPTLVLMKNGKILKKSVGFSDEQELIDMINEFKA